MTVGAYPAPARNRCPRVGDADARTITATRAKPCNGPHPTVVMAHGFSAVKEMYLDKFAEAFARSGLASVVYDNRNFGASDGEPRQEIDPWLQVRDFSEAITFAQRQGETDAERIAVWGSSYSGGHVLVVAAIDRRVKCVVSQVPAISGSQGFRRLVRADMIAGLNAMLAQDRRDRADGKAPAMLPVVDENPAAMSALPTADSYTWFTQTQQARAPSWRNEVTLRTSSTVSATNPAHTSATSARRRCSSSPSRIIWQCRTWPSRPMNRPTSPRSWCCCRGAFRRLRRRVPRGQRCRVRMVRSPPWDRSTLKSSRKTRR